jgi:hypothetical protein
MAFRLFSFIPREEKFYNDFQMLADELKKGAGALEAMLAADHPVWEKADEIKEIEHKCDFLTHETIQRLNRTFVTPIDREDIFALARSLDDVMDAIDAAASLVRLYRLTTVRFGARELAHVITASAHAVRLAVAGMEQKEGASAHSSGKHFTGNQRRSGKKTCAKERHQNAKDHDGPRRPCHRIKRHKQGCASGVEHKGISATEFVCREAEAQVAGEHAQEIQCHQELGRVHQAEAAATFGYGKR